MYCTAAALRVSSRAEELQTSEGVPTCLFPSCLATCARLTDCQIPPLQVRGEVHHDRRLHQLMLREASAHFDVSAGGKAGGSAADFLPALSNTTSHTTSLSDSAGSVHSDLAQAAAYYSAVVSPTESFR